VALIKDELSEKIIGCAYKVYSVLGAGFLESVYKKALILELRKDGLKTDEECPIEVRYEETIVGSFYADIFVEGRIILELKAVDALTRAHEIQLVNYLKATGLPIGLLINFGTSGITIKRKYKDREIGGGMVPGDA
jgi:GxxExxY protein